MTTTTKPSYGSATALTLTLASLASDSNLLAGRSSTVVDNTTALAIDALVSAKITTGTSPTVSTTIEVWAWAITDDGPSYPDTVTGSDANTSLTSTNVKQAGAFKLGAVITVDATSNRAYYASFSLAALFGGVAPKEWGIYVAQNTGAALNSTGGNHFVKYTPVQFQNV